MELFFYLERPSPLHRLHPVTKLALLAGNGALALLLARPPLLGAALLLVLAQTALARALANVSRVVHFLLVASVAAVALWTLVGRGATPLLFCMTREGFVA